MSIFGLEHFFAVWISAINASESLVRLRRKIRQARGGFSSDEAVCRLPHLAQDNRRPTPSSFLTVCGMTNADAEFSKRRPHGVKPWSLGPHGAHSVL